MAPRVSIITGAGSGIGRALAQLLSRRGDAIVLVGRRQDRLDETATRCTGPTLVRAADCRGHAAAQEVVHAALHTFGRIDTLVNGAGVAPLVALDATTEELLVDTFAVNAFGPAALIHRCWGTFVAQGCGRIVNLSTLGTTDPFEGYFAYAAAKSALDSMTRSAAREGKRHGIVAFSINFGCVDTEMLRKNFSTAHIPAERTHSPETAAAFIQPFVDGERDGDSGQCVPMPSP